jgi:hypothetical protein
MKKPGPTRITIKTILCDGRKATRHLRTPPNTFLSPQNIDALLDAEAKRVEEYFPGLEFRLVPLAGGITFNFVEVPPSEVAAGQGAESAEIESASASLVAAG